MGKRRNKAQEARNERAAEPLSPKQLLAKAAVLAGNAVDESSAIQQIEQTETLFGSNSAITPDYDPATMLSFIELSPHLAPNIAAYSQNIEGYGYHYEFSEPWMADLESEEAHEAVKQALLIEQWMDAQEELMITEAQKQEILERIELLQEKHDEAVKKKRTAKTIAKWKKQIDDAEQEVSDLEEEREDGDVADEIPEEMITAKLAEIAAQIKREQFLFDAFFKNCCSTMSFTKLRRISRSDYESHGWSCWEMQRDAYKRLKRLSYVPAFTVRPLVDPGEMIEVVESDPVTPLSEGREISVWRRFRLFVQVVEDKKIYFKSPGDPRIVSRTTGKVYKTVAQMRMKKNEGPEAKEANELLWRAQHSPKTPCPPPRWIGNLLQVLGGREADETNYFYLRDNAIPYGLLFVSGGFIPGDIKERIEHRLAAEIRGSRGAGKVLIVQAKPMGKEPDGRTIIPSMEFQSLREAHEKDALFAGYDERGGDRIGASFRLPPILRGYTPSTLNRATAMASIFVGEQQVFAPERGDVDWDVNKHILPELDIKYLVFVSNSPPTKSVEDVERIVKAAAPQGGLLPYEIRQLLGDLFNRPLTEVKEDWARVPMVMTLAGFGPAAEGGGETGMEQGERIEDLSKQFARIEARVGEIVRQELQAFGVDAEVSAAFMEPKAEGQ